MAYREIRQIYPQPGWVEHDPAEIWRSVLDCVGRGAAKRDGSRPARSQGIGITNQRESTILWDRDTGRPVVQLHLLAVPPVRRRSATS